MILLQAPQVIGVAEISMPKPQQNLRGVKNDKRSVGGKPLSFYPFQWYSFRRKKTLSISGIVCG